MKLIATTAHPLRPTLPLLGLAFVLGSAMDAGAQDARSGLWNAIAREGSARVIVRFTDEPSKRRATPLARRTQVRRAQREIVGRLSGTRYAMKRAFERIPAVALEVGASALARLERSPRVAEIFEDRPHAPALADATFSVQALSTWAAGVRGKGQVVAVLDTGVDSSHPFLRNAVVHEACFSQSGDCPNGSDTQTGPGAAAPCAFAERACAHGTHVAGIVAGRSAEVWGVAPEASVIAIQVFSRSNDCRPGETTPCPRTYTSDYIRALEYVGRLREHYPIAAANLSFAGGSFDSMRECDERNPVAKDAVDALRAAGIAVIAAAGNARSSSELGSPACLSSSISVGSVDADGGISSFSNHSTFLDLVAPGRSIESSVPGGGFAHKSGTSMAAPIVAGAWALMRQSDPHASVDLIHTAFSMTGDQIEDPDNASFVPRIDIRAANDFLEGNCACADDVESFCDYPAYSCRRTAPGGYCDPNGDGDFADADWVRGWDEFQSDCRAPEPEPSREELARWLPKARSAPGSRGTRSVGATLRAEGRR